MGRSFYSGVDAVLFVYSIDSKHSFKSLLDLEQDVQENCQPNVIKYLVGNKNDQSIRTVTNEEMLLKVDEFDCDEAFEVAANDPVQVNAMFSKIAEKLASSERRARSMGSFKLN